MEQMEETRDTQDTLGYLRMQLHTLALFRGLLQQEVPAKLLALLDALENPGDGWIVDCQRGDPFCNQDSGLVDAYCEFVAALYKNGGDLGAHLLQLVLEAETPAARTLAAGRELPAPMAQSLQNELAAFSAASRLSPRDVAGEVGKNLPLWGNTPCDFAAEYEKRQREMRTRGYGIFAAYHMFTLGEGTRLLPVKNPDPQRLSQLTGYARERGQILVNTKALLRGLPANNILLYGDAGTGKSSTVKALANEYCTEGLRLVEIRKNQLYQIPGLMDTLAENPLKFIFFIDDLSFPADDRDFTALKAILEGNVSARPHNIVVYATSNRRHMVKERFSDRQGDDLHLGDTLEEEASLAARFGLTVTFLKPDRELYANIVQNLAAEYGVAMDEAELLAKAEAHAIRYGGRSPRTARQFVEYLRAEQG